MVRLVQAFPRVGGVYSSIAESSLLQLTKIRATTVMSECVVVHNEAALEELFPRCTKARIKVSCSL